MNPLEWVDTTIRKWLIIGFGFIMIMMWFGIMGPMMHGTAGTFWIGFAVATVIAGGVWYIFRKQVQA